MSEKSIIIEYDGGFSEPCADETQAAQKVRYACVHRSDTLHCGGMVVTQKYIFLAFYERDINDKKRFVARIFATEAQLNLINQKI